MTRLGSIAGTIDNFGTIFGGSGIAINLGAGDDRIIIEPGSSLFGAVSNFQSGDSFDLPFETFSNTGTATLGSGNALKISRLAFHIRALSCALRSDTPRAM